MPGSIDDSLAVDGGHEPAESIHRDPALDDAWLICGGCRTPVYGRAFERSGRVCTACGWHGPVTAHQRIGQLLDAEPIDHLAVASCAEDPLGFVDTKPYPQRLAEARARTGLDDAVVCVRGAVRGHPVIAAVMDFRFLGGSLGSAAGEAVTIACEVALREQTPLLLVTASGGARMQEGALSLMQMAKTSQAIGRLDRAGVATISIIADPTFGGVAASFATLCDVIVAEPGARLGFAGPRVIEQTIKETLPAGFQGTAFLLEHGVVDMVVTRTDLPDAVARLLGAALPVTAPARPTDRPTDAAEHVDGDAWERVRTARRLTRPTTMDYISLLLEEFTELHGDRISTDCPAMVSGVGRFAGRPIAVIGTQKGHDAAELSAHDFGMPGPSGYRKAARVMRLAEKWRLPVLTLVDTAGAYPGVSAEENGQAAAIAGNLRLMAGLDVPTVAVITGEGGSGGALALAVADRVLMLSNAVYSVISPEGCASILWKDAAHAPRAADALSMDAWSLLALGIVDGVVAEPEDGVDTDRAATAAAIRAAVGRAFDDLMTLDRATLLERRHDRFRAFGRAPTTLRPEGTAS